MGISAGPNIIRDTSLVLSLDASDANSFNKNLGRVWSDTSGNNTSGSIINGPSLNNDSIGSFSFNGINSYIKVNSNPLYQPLSTLTVECAFKRNSGRTVLSYSSDNLGAMKTYSFECTPNLLAKITTSTQQYTLSATINTNTWYYTTITYNGSLFSLYMDGVLSTSTAASGNITYEGSANLNFGRKNDADGEYVSGSISIVKIYNKALSASEVQQNYNQYKTRFNRTTPNIITYTSLNTTTAIESFNDVLEFTNVLVGYPSFGAANAVALVNETP
jgi:hypothetical protein